MDTTKPYDRKWSLKRLHFFIKRYCQKNNINEREHIEEKIYKRFEVKSRRYLTDTTISMLIDSYKFGIDEPKNIS